jgi:putative oxidoreductase
MHIAIWIVQIILAIKLISTSFSHGLRQSQPDMQQAIDKMGKASRIWHTLIAILAFVLAVGLILPGWLGFYPQLVIWVAAVAAVMMLVSIYFHVRFRDKPKVFVGIVLFAFAVFIAYGRLILAPF